MKIAVTYNEGEVFQHFGHSKQFKIYEIEENKIINTSILDTNGTGHGVICDLLKNNNINVLICGGIGNGAKDLLNKNKIEIYAGVKGKADEKLNDFLNNKLQYNNEIKCNHHEHHDHHEHHCSSEKGGCKGNH